MLLSPQPQQAIPSIHIPLHTVIELTPRPDGTIGVEYIPVPIQLSEGGALHSSMESTAAAVAAQEQQQATAAAAVAQELLLQQQLDVLAEQHASGSPAAGVSAAAAADAAVVIGDAVLPGKGSSSPGHSRSASELSTASGHDWADVQRASSCSSSNTIAQMAAAVAAAQNGPAAAALGGSGMHRGWHSCQQLAS